MQINTKFNLNDYVYPIVCGGEEIWIPCTTCDGSGIVKIKNSDREFQCPDCYGNKGRNEWTTNGWHLSNYKSQVGLIRTETDKNKSKTNYMLKATGIGSGTIWKEDDLFSSKEEAQKECDLRNENNK